VEGDIVGQRQGRHIAQRIAEQQANQQRAILRFSAGPIASILSPFVLGMLVDRFFASQKVMAVMHQPQGHRPAAPDKELHKHH
jgi:F0F1-type ATP synthase assembly protein I